MVPGMSNQPPLPRRIHNRHQDIQEAAGTPSQPLSSSSKKPSLHSSDYLGKLVEQIFPVGETDSGVPLSQRWHVRSREAPSFQSAITAFGCRDTCLLSIIPEHQPFFTLCCDWRQEKLRHVLIKSGVSAAAPLCSSPWTLSTYHSLRAVCRGYFLYPSLPPQFTRSLFQAGPNCSSLKQCYALVI